METPEGFEAQATYAKPFEGGALPSFKIAEANLGTGASLGNSAIWVHTKGTGAIERVFLNDVSQSLIGTISLRFGAHSRPLGRVHLNEHTDEKPTYSGIFTGPGQRVFKLHPAYQRVSYTLKSVLDVSETTFLPLGTAKPGHEDQPLVYITVEVHNRDTTAHHIRVMGSATLRGSTPADIQTRFEKSANALVAWNKSRPEWVRIFGLSEAPSAYGGDFDYGGTYDITLLHDVRNKTSAEGDVIGRLQLDMILKAGERRKFCFIAGVYANGQAEALRRYARKEDGDRALQQSEKHLTQVLRYGCVLTPDPVINHGALWSKVNMRRVMATYPTGCAFTNDPGKYANIVVRDCAWFVFGNDHFLPSFSRDLLDNIASRQYDNGKLPEYFDADTGRIEDDGLNINDDTPLYILAVNHHFRATGDFDWFAKMYPSVARAARYIISQVDARGLVFCSADDSRGNVWGIAGWRNIIPDYTINGAVTEINAECVAALRAASHLADAAASERDKMDFSEASGRIREAMDTYLINPHNGMYYLNIDVDGNVRTDVTGDEIFPVIMRACSDETAFRIISRLNGSDFWTPAGLRTVSRLDPRYDPAAFSGLLGGVWPGLTWWYAFAAARYHPEMMVRALRSSFAHYGDAPRRYNTVPGQFSEWFDGENLVNHGMRLSPWEPPRFLWAAIEGVCGLMLTLGAPQINPLIPPGWRWVGVRELPYHGSFLSYFLVREGDAGFRIYSTADVQSDWGVELYGRDVTDDVHIYSDSVVSMALARENEMAILIGNTGQGTVFTPVTIRSSAPLKSRFLVRVYNSELGAWEPGFELTAAQLRAFSIVVEAGGFRVLEITGQQEPAADAPPAESTNAEPAAAR
jgi:mannosylglycerate hydrolase MGH1-like protein